MVIARAAIFSDATIIRRLQTEFVPFAGKRLELEQGPLSQWWIPLLQNLRPNWRQGYSSQGSYVAGSDGVGHAFDNYNTDARRFNALLDRGLASFRRAQPRTVQVSTEMARAAQPMSPPPGASVLRIFTRIHPLPAGSHESNRGLGREHVWVLADEMRAMAAARDGQSFAMPRAFVARLVTFGLSDNVRGQVWHFQPGDVRQANFTAQATRTNGSLRSFTFSATFLKRGAIQSDSDRGVEGRLEGEFEVDTTPMKIVRFRAFADTQAWSGNPGARFPTPPGRYPLLFAIVEANDALAQAVPPEVPNPLSDYYLRTQLPNAR